MIDLITMAAEYQQQYEDGLRTESEVISCFISDLLEMINPGVDLEKEED